MDFSDILILIFVPIVILGFFAMLIVAAILQKKNGSALPPPPPEPTFDEEPEVTEMHAEIVDHLCYVGTEGIKTPKTTSTFLVYFKDDGGKVHPIPVTEETYHDLELGLVGKLTLYDGVIHSFVPDDF